MQTATMTGRCHRKELGARPDHSLQQRKVGKAAICEHGQLLNGSLCQRRSGPLPQHTTLRHLCQASTSHTGDSSFRQPGNAVGSGSISFNNHNKTGSTVQKTPTAGNLQNSSTKDAKVDRLAQLRQYGLAGVVAYGLLNTLYYSITFLFVWLVVAKVPTGQGTAVAARSFLAVMATVWAGSQVTKIARAAGALVLAPIVDKGLEWLQGALKLRNKNQAFLIILATCISFAIAIFGTVVMAWA